MKTYIDPLWGYKLVYPDSWATQKNEEIQAFAASKQALEQNYTGPNSGFLLVRGEFNHTGEKLAALWNDHITKISMMMGAKNLGSAPLMIGGAKGFEAEIVMPKSQNKRLWVGILSYGLTILHIMAEHPIDQRDWFEPLATEIVRSLRFKDHTSEIGTTIQGIPLPPGFSPTAPSSILTDLEDDQGWLAYTGEAGIGPLQAFYLRELPGVDWEIKEFVPYPNQTEINFARMQISKGEQTATLGIMPGTPGETSSAVIIKTT